MNFFSNVTFLSFIQLFCEGVTYRDGNGLRRHEEEM
jgi:hypothetical protein